MKILYGVLQSNEYTFVKYDSHAWYYTHLISLLDRRNHTHGCTADCYARWGERAVTHRHVQGSHNMSSDCIGYLGWGSTATADDLPIATEWNCGRVTNHKYTCMRMLTVHIYYTVYVTICYVFVFFIKVLSYHSHYYSCSINGDVVKLNIQYGWLPYRYYSQSYKYGNI